MTTAAISKQKGSNNGNTIERQLSDACLSGDLVSVKSILRANPAVDVTWQRPESYRWTALHAACYKGHHEVVSVLLAHPDIDVNACDRFSRTAFFHVGITENIEVAKVLLKDPRVDINMADGDRRTTLWCASYNGHAEVIKWMVALRGDELDLEKKNYESPPIEIAREKNLTEVVALLERLNDNPSQTRHEIRVELGLIDELAAELFALTVFLCDDFMRLKEPSTASSPDATGAFRFFKIAKKLPMELQMVLCHRVFGSSKENIKSKDSEPAFKRLAATTLTSEPPPSPSTVEPNFPFACLRDLFWKGLASMFS
jgi:hypothetical protein